MSSIKRKHDAVTPTKPPSSRSSSVSSRGSYRTRPESDDDERFDESPQVISKRPKLFSTPSSSRKGRKKPVHANTEVDEVDFLAHPKTPEATPSKTPRTKKEGKTPRTIKKTAVPSIVIVSRPCAPENPTSSSATRGAPSTPSKSQRRTVSPSKTATNHFDLDATPRADASRPFGVISESVGNPLFGSSNVPSFSTSSVPLKPAVPGAARGRKKAATRQLVRGDTDPSINQGSATHSSSASAGGYSNSAASTDEEAPISSSFFSNLKPGTSPKKTPSAARKLHASPNKQRLANGDVYVDYMVPMPQPDDDVRRHGLSSGDEGAYISSSADDSEPQFRALTSKHRGRALPEQAHSYSLASRAPPSVSRSSSVSHPPSLSGYTTSSPYTSRGPSPSPSFPRSQVPSESDDTDSDDAIYDHQHHVDPIQHLNKLASLARMALASAEDMRKQGVMREGEPPLPRCFLTGVIVEPGKPRGNNVPKSPSKRGEAPDTETETDGEGVTIIRALPERHLGQINDDLPSRSRSWLDTVLLGPSGPPKQELSRQTSSSSITTDVDNPFDNSRTSFRRTNSQPSINMNVPKRPDPTQGLSNAQSEPALEAVLAAYDMTPSRSRTIHMTPSKSRLTATPSRMRLFGTPSRRARMKEVEEEDEVRPTSQEFNTWLAKQQVRVLGVLRNPIWAKAMEKGLEDAQPATGKPSEAWVEGEEDETEAVAKLRDLLRRTVETGEGNSCLLVGPKGSGKTRTVTRALKTLIQASRWQPKLRSSTPPPATVPSSPTKPGRKSKQGSSRGIQSASEAPAQPAMFPALTVPIVIQLSGHSQINDRLAMREIARQLVLQSGEALEVPLDDTEHELDELDESPASVHIPTATHLPQIVGALARQIRPVIVVLDAFDLFAEHARQALLYCLLDTVQSCRAGQGSRGLAVVGVTSRIDCLTMLEKRVKSRFSHRIIRVSPPPTVDSYMSLILSSTNISERLEEPRLQATPRKNRREPNSAQQSSWREAWRDSVSRAIVDRQFKQIIEDLFDLSRDVRLLIRILSGAIAGLTPSSPWLTVGAVARSIQTQCAPLPFTFLQELAYPCVTLLVATQHIHDKGHDIFTFKMLCDEIKRELGNEAVTKALVQVQGRGLGLMRVPESVLETAFEQLVAHNIIVLAGPASTSTRRVYIKYRCMPDRSDVKEAVERLGHSALKRWFVQGASS